MRRIIAGLCAVAGLSLFSAVVPASAAGAHPAIPAFTCATAKSYMQTVSARDAAYISSANRVRSETFASFFCANKQTLTNAELEIYGTGNCWTYNANNYLDSVTCGNKVSQRWTWYSDGEITNAYTGSKALNANAAGTNLVMDPWVANENEEWVIYSA
jgi:uncharacterized protein (DUF2147 family)